MEQTEAPEDERFCDDKPVTSEKPPYQFIGLEEDLRLTG
jgi:hypothetical protein